MINPLSPSWFPPADRPVLSVAKYLPPYPLTVLVAIACLTLPPGWLRQSVFVPLAISTLYVLRARTLGTVDLDYMSFLNVCWLLLRWIDFVILHIPERAFFRVSHESTAIETPEVVAHLSTWRKLCWSFSFHMTLRGITWNWKVARVPVVPADMTRLQYCVNQLGRIVFYLLVLDLYSFLQDRTVISRLGPNPSDLSYWSQSVPIQLYVAWSGIFNAGCAIALGNAIPALFGVASQISQPRDWPNAFGSFTQAYTLRNVWGYCWHQYLRRIFETCNGLVLGAFRIRKGTLLSKYVQLYNAFLVSACFHHLGASNIPWLPDTKSQAIFFLLQPFFITIEDVAIAIGKRAGMRKNSLTIFLGYIWVIASLSFTSRYMAAFYFDCGLGAVKTIPWRGICARILD